MRRLCSFVVFAAVGVCVGLAAWSALLAFSPNCGYDCEVDRLNFFIITEAACLTGFIGLWYLALRNTRHPAKRVFRVCFLAALLVLGPTWAVYGWNLYTHYRELEAWYRRLPRPSLEFSHMAIATRAVPTMSAESEGLPHLSRRILQWERCLIGTTACDGNPRTVELRCQDGIVNVSDAHWHAFSLIPSEDLPGILPLRSMALCTDDNVVE